jgi:hypothetical protein
MKIGTEWLSLIVVIATIWLGAHYDCIGLVAILYCIGGVYLVAVYFKDKFNRKLCRLNEKLANVVGEINYFIFVTVAWTTLIIVCWAFVGGN